MPKRKFRARQRCLNVRGEYRRGQCLNPRSDDAQQVVKFLVVHGNLLCYLLFNTKSGVGFPAIAANGLNLPAAGYLTRGVPMPSFLSP
jgi:hypothetical protein